jgi:hypothetical protein
MPLQKGTSVLVCLLVPQIWINIASVIASKSSFHSSRSHMNHSGTLFYAPRSPAFGSLTNKCALFNAHRCPLSGSVQLILSAMPCVTTDKMLLIIRQDQKKLNYRMACHFFRMCLELSQHQRPQSPRSFHQKFPHALSLYKYPTARTPG